MPGLAQPADHRRVPTAGVHHDIGADLIAAVEADADDMRDTASVLLDQQAGDPRTAAHDQTVRRRRGHVQRRLQHRAPGGPGVEPLVPRPPAAGHLLRVVMQHAHPAAAHVRENVDGVWDLGTHDRRPAGQCDVHLTELGDARPLPPGPDRVDGQRRRRGIALEHGDPMARPGQQDGSGEAGHAGSEDDDTGHDNLRDGAGGLPTVARRAAHLPGHPLSDRCPSAATVRDGTTPGSGRDRPISTAQSISSSRSVARASWRR
jgi:hypothetical protein